ncbi:START domain-containing protein 10, partial [Cichlidogyrus casuarinus]
MGRYAVGEIRPPTDEDFSDFKNFILSNDGWSLKYNSKGVSVSTREASNSSLKMFKVVTTFKDISAEVLYDTIHDPEYRVDWDIAMSAGYEICRVSDDSDIGYYA